MSKSESVSQLNLIARQNNAVSEDLKVVQGTYITKKVVRNLFFCHTVHYVCSTNLSFRKLIWFWYHLVFFQHFTHQRLDKNVEILLFLQQITIQHVKKLCHSVLLLVERFAEVQNFHCTGVRWCNRMLKENQMVLTLVYRTLIKNRFIYSNFTAKHKTIGQNWLAQCLIIYKIDLYWSFWLIN